MGANLHSVSLGETVHFFGETRMYSRVIIFLVISAATTDAEVNGIVPETTLVEARTEAMVNGMTMSDMSEDTSFEQSMAQPWQQSTSDQWHGSMAEAASLALVQETMAGRPQAGTSSRTWGNQSSRWLETSARRRTRPPRPMQQTRQSGK